MSRLKPSVPEVLGKDSSNSKTVQKGKVLKNRIEERLKNDSASPNTKGSARRYASDPTLSKSDSGSGNKLVRIEVSN